MNYRWMGHTISFTIVLLVVHIYFINAEASAPTQHYNLIVPMLSEACIRINEQGPNTTCPTLNTLVPYDTSNQRISGYFDHSGNHWIRTNPEVKNHYMFYQYNTKPVICVECYFPGKEADSVQVIIINPAGFIWVDVNEKISNGKVTLHHDRYVSPDCMNAQISFTPFIFNDTLRYMENGCKVTNYNNNSTLTLKNTPFQMNNPFSSLIYQAYLKMIFHGSMSHNGNHTAGGQGPKICIIHKCNYVDPYANPRFGK